MKARAANDIQPSQEVTLTRVETITVLIPLGIALDDGTLEALANAGMGLGGIAGGLVTGHNMSAWEVKQ